MLFVLPMAAAWVGCTTTVGGGGNGGGVTNDNVATNDNTPQNDNTGGVGSIPTWGRAFDGNYTGALTSVWGTGPDDIFAVGGQATQGEVYHYDGQVWQAMDVPDVPLLAWVFGFAANNVYACGEGGGVIHYDGSSWTALDSGTDQVLWCVWGRSEIDLWFVGGNPSTDDPPVILNYNRSTFTSVDAPPNDRNASALFTVWGIGERVFAAGSLGLIIELDAATREWTQATTGGAANQDFLCLMGTSETNIVVVGGRAPNGARICVFDGQTWTTTEFSQSLGLSAIYLTEDNLAMVGGVNGYVGMFDPSTNTLVDEIPGTTEAIRGIWNDGEGRYYCVGGRFVTPFYGVGLLRTVESSTSGDTIRPGEQPDNNQDDLPDAPLTVAGTAPDPYVEPSDNDNTPEPPPPDDEITTEFGRFDDDTGDYAVLAEGSDLPVLMDFQSAGVFFIDPVFRITGLPADAVGELVTVTHTLTLVADSREISFFAGLGILSDVDDQPGVIQLVRSYQLGIGVTVADADNQMATFSITVEYDGTTPPTVVTASQTFRLFDAEAQ